MLDEYMLPIDVDLDAEANPFCWIVTLLDFDSLCALDVAVFFFFLGMGDANYDLKKKLSNNSEFHNTFGCFT